MGRRTKAEKLKYKQQQLREKQQVLNIKKGEIKMATTHSAKFKTTVKSLLPSTAVFYWGTAPGSYEFSKTMVLDGYAGFQNVETIVEELLHEVPYYAKYTVDNGVGIFDSAMEFGENTFTIPLEPVGPVGTALVIEILS